MPVIIVGGPSGTGKTTVGQELARLLRERGDSVCFIEGDNLHSEENIAKMSAGIPLMDVDRWPWLERLSKESVRGAATHSYVVVTCSMLRRVYRDYLNSKIGSEGWYPLRMYLLNNTYENVLQQMRARQHFFKPDMLRSQYDTFEPGVKGEANVVNVKCEGKTPVELAEEIIKDITLGDNCARDGATH
ncbi:uncharacterized protein C5L36_0B09560 [Pichia kudriavzevii]|uniref:Gluconokinase n=1 Tax=Pichia kudriavzevii TaxID=4909 RepID=A0A2U9R322_PICKU|nr:uncharacterized protein C5L36_0B09560 [Pichia kudriavzevii]AWU75715.1 hypothetical protein C5L36_0B09560 [Pichia kudriavzevii]